MTYSKLLSGHMSGEGLWKTTEAKYGQSVSQLRIKTVTITSQKFEAACLVHFYSCKSDKIKNETAHSAAHLMKKSNSYRPLIGNYFLWEWWGDTT